VNTFILSVLDWSRGLTFVKFSRLQPSICEFWEARSVLDHQIAYKEDRVEVLEKNTKISKLRIREKPKSFMFK
jgi:hypothetical protein